MDELEKLLNHEPLVPFRIVLTSGHGYVVTSPYQAVVEGARINYYHARSDRSAKLRLNQCAALETLETE